MISRSNIIIFIVFIICIFGLFKIKYKVLELRRDTKDLTAQLENEKRELNTLKVEWAYLTNPQRIATLASKYLNLSKTNIQRVSEVKTSQSSKVNLEEKKPKIMHIAYKHASGKWRYRKDHQAVSTKSHLKNSKNDVKGNE